MPWLRASIPRRQPNQPQPQAVYTFHPSQARQNNPGNGTTYVLNSTVRNRQNQLRYTVATVQEVTTVKNKDGVTIARIDWDHARYPRIEYRGTKAVKCKKWFKYGVARLTRTVRAYRRTYRWARVDREDIFTFTRDREGAPSSCIAGLDDHGLLVAEFQESAQDTTVKDALVVALVLLHGENGWLKLGQFGPNPRRYMEKSLPVALAFIGMGRSIVGAG